MSDTIAANTSTNGSLAVNTSVTSAIDSGGDEDWFQLSLQFGERYQFDLKGEDSGGGTLPDPYLVGLFDASGNYINGSSDDDHGTGLDSQLVYIAQTSGIHYVAAGAYGSMTGTYTLSVSDLGQVDDYASTTSTSGSIGAGSSQNGNIEVAGDRDWFRITLQSSMSYQFDLEGSPTAAGTLSDPYFAGLYDANGILVSGTSDDDGGSGYNSRIEFTASSSGTYYLSAGSIGSSTGTYTLSATAFGSGDDYGADTSTGGGIGVGASASGEIEVSGDVDWFRVNFQSGFQYQIDLEGSPTSGGTLSDTYLIGLYNANGSLISGTADDDSGTGLNSSLEFTASSSGNYYIAAAAYSSGTGTYTVSVSSLGDTGDDYAANSTTTGSVSIGGSISGNLEMGGDVDWFEVTLQAGVQYQIDLQGAATSEGTLLDPYLIGLYDVNGTYISSSSNDDGGTGLNSQLEFTAPGTGSFYVAAGAYLSNIGTYTVSISSLESADDYPSNVSTGGSVSAGGSVNGTIEEAGDRDWFQVTLQAGARYMVDLEGVDTASGTLSDPYLVGLYDADGLYINGSSDDDSGTGLNSEVEITATSSGTYYLAAGAYGSTTGTYRLSLSSIGTADDYAADSSTAGSVAVNGSSEGTLESSGDVDWFKVTLQAGVQYQFDLEGADTSGGTLSDPYLVGLYNAAGTYISGSSDDDSGTGLNSQLEYTASSSGTYYLAAGAYGSANGSYSVSVSQQGNGDDYSADSSTGGNVTVNGSSRGNHESSGDEDWFRVTLQAGVQYRIALEGVDSSAGTLSDPYLVGLYDADGLYINGSSDDDSGTGLNSEVEITATSSGTYYLAAGAYGSTTGTYRLSLSSIGTADDYAADSSTTGSVAVNGSSGGNLEISGDVDWFNVTLQAEVQYRITLEGVDSRAGTLSDPYLVGLYDANGGFVSGSSDDDSGTGLNSQLDFTASGSGTYYLAAGAFGSNTGTYKISVAATGTDNSDDHGESTSDAGSIAVGQSVVATIEEAGDRDWFRVSFAAGGSYTINLEGAPTSAGSLADPYLFGIYEANGNAISGTSDDDGGSGNNSQLEFTASNSGIFYVAAGAYGSGTGDYKLSIVQNNSQSDDYGATIAAAGSLTLGTVKNGSIEVPNDEDWFAVTLEGGKDYRIDIEGSPTSGGTLSDTYLSGIYDANGSLINNTSNDDGGVGTNSQLSFSPSTGGQYYVAARGFGSVTGTYNVSVTDATVDDSPDNGGMTGDFNIEVDYNGPTQYQQYFESAAHRWMQIIVGDLQDFNTQQYGFIDDLKIEASIAEIDGVGAVLGRAGPDLIRNSPYLPLHGSMMFDIADADNMVNKGIFEAVVLHEMGHVLGISNWMFDNFHLIEGFNYQGTNALNEYRLLAGDSSLTFIPLEDEGGSGTAGSHWDEQVFNIELMTGYAENAPPMPISRVTIGALEDLGYLVDFSQADSYSLPGNSSLLALLSSTAAALSPEQGGVQPGPQISAILSTDAFTGSRYHYQDDKPLILAPSATLEKLTGAVTSSTANSVTFIETGTGHLYTVKLEGNFEKSIPTSSLDIKGSVNSITFYDSFFQPLTRLQYETARDAGAVIDNWQGNFLSDANLISTSFDTADVINAGSGNDVIQTNGGNDTVDGGEGIDALIYRGASSDYTITPVQGGFTVSDSTVQRDGQDLLSGIERLSFTDVNVALDIDGNAGSVAKILGAVFGEDYVSNRNYVGIGLHYLDTGTSYEDLMRIAINAKLGQTRTNRDVVDLLFENVVGVAPTDNQAQAYVNLLDNHTHTIGSLGVLAAETGLNKLNIDLVGLADTGLPFFEYGV